MGWIADDGTHEGYLEVVLIDGAVMAASCKDGPLVRSGEQPGPRGDGLVLRSDDEIVEWRVACDCYTGESMSPTRKWTGSSWQRVATLALEDLHSGRVFIRPGELAMDLSEREDVADLAIANWREAHIEPDTALSDIQAETREIAQAERRRAEAVGRARALGKSWQDIGRAASMARQSAYDRWASATK